MKKRAKRFLICMALASVMTMGTAFQALAARIAFSDPTVTTGETVTVNMKITSTGGETISNADVMLAYDSSALEFISGDGASGGAGAIRVTGSSESQGNTELAFTLTFRGLRAGTSSITITSQEVYDSDSQLVEVGQQGTSTVTVTAAASDSTNAKLAGLQISSGTLSPAFSPDVESYSVTVGGDVTSLLVDAPAVDAGASVSVTGNENLQVGENQVICTVTAQDGQTVKTYTINVTKVEGSADGSEAAPAGGVVLKTPERTVTVLPATEDVPIPEGFVPCSVSIDGYDVEGWVWGPDSESPQYCIFYASNGTGENEFYRYDLTEKTLQRYFRDPADTGEGSEYAALADEYNSLLKDYNIRFYIIIGLIALAVVLLIVIIALIATRGGKDDFYEGRRDNSDYPQKRKAQKQSDADRRRAAREEHYRQVLADEEAARRGAYPSDAQARARQAQRRQADLSGQPMRQGQQVRSGSPSGQPMRQGQQRPAGQQARQMGAAGQPNRQPGQGSQQVRSGNPSGQQARPSGQKPASQNYVVRGPLTGDEDYDNAERNRRFQEPPQRRPQEKPGSGSSSGSGNDDDFDFVDLGI